MAERFTRRAFAIRCDAMRELGVGHLVRQLALIEELVGRGHRVVLIGDIEVEWVARQAQASGAELLPAMDAPAVVELAVREGLDAVMIDGYRFPADLGRSLREAGVPVATLVDGEFGAHQVADLSVDQNLGSAAPEDADGEWLVGPEYVLLRDVVRSRRDDAREPAEPPRLLVVFGGTDPFGGAPVLTELILRTGLPVEVAVIAASDDARAALAQLRTSPGQRLDVLPPQNDLPALAVTCDAAVSAAGSSVWEFACLGLPTALVCVVDNQQLGYDAATQELCLPLGHLAQLRGDDAAREAAVAQIARLLRDGPLRREMAARGTRMVDGDGRVRVADALEGLAR